MSLLATAGALLAAAAAPATVITANFSAPVLVHQSFNGQHAWFSAVAATRATPTDELALVMSLGGDGTGCPAPGVVQNCSMAQHSADGGRTWAPVEDWSRHSFNELVPDPAGSPHFKTLGYGTVKKSADNMTAGQLGWGGAMLPNGTVVVDAWYNVTFTFDPARAAGGAPAWPGVLVHSGTVVPSRDPAHPGALLTTLYGHGAGVYRKWDAHPSTFVVRSGERGDVTQWTLLSEIPWMASYGNFSDGPAEPEMARLADGRLLMVFRADADAPFWRVYSADEGATWVNLTRMQDPATGVAQWAVRPQLRVAPAGEGTGGQPLLFLSGGRPGVYLWVSADHGDSWTEFSLAAEHNKRVQPSPAAPNMSHLLFSDEVTAVRNYTEPRADPPGTTSYTGLAFDSTGTLVVSYDRLSNGWSGATPTGRWGPFDSVWTMRVTVQLQDGEAEE